MTFKPLQDFPDMGISLVYYWQIESGFYYIYDSSDLSECIGEAETKRDAYIFASQYFSEMMQ